MKMTRILVLVLLTTAAFSISARAQSFSSSTVATTDSDVYNAGATALAFDYNDLFNGTTTTVNGVTFSGNPDNSATGVSLSLSNLSLDLATFSDGASNGVYAPGLASTATANYAYILTSLAYNNNNLPATLTLNGLKAGETYELQVFAGTEGASGTETLTDVTGPTLPSPSGSLNYGLGTPSASAADFIDESFTAVAGGTETITIAAPQQYLILNAINLQVVPEPSTYALMLGGLGCLVFLIRRKAFGAV